MDGIFINEKKNIIVISLVPMPEIDMGMRLVNRIIGVNAMTYRKLMSIPSAIIMKYVCIAPRIHIVDDKMDNPMTCFFLSGYYL